MNGHDSKRPAYEQSDVHIRGVVIFAVVLTLATALVFVLMAATYRVFESRERTRDDNAVPATLVPVAGPNHPPEPVLQGAPGSRFELRDPLPEMLEMRREEDELLSTAGWADRDAGRVRIPIEDAKRILLERGFPARTEAPR